MLSWDRKVSEICEIFDVKKEEKFRLTCMSIDNLHTKEKLYWFTDSGLKSVDKTHCKEEMYLLLFGDLVISKMDEESDK